MAEPVPSADTKPGRANGGNRDPAALDRRDRSRTAAFLGSSMPYLGAAVLAAGAMAWYFFVFVPAKLDYFVGLRFRTLAVAAGQIASKEEALAKALRGAIKFGGGDRPVRKRALLGYFAALVPEMRFSTLPGAGLSAEKIPGLHLKLDNAGKDIATVDWADVVRAAAQASRRDFADLILADSGGDVLWQREDATPRVDSLLALINTEADPAHWFSFSWQVRPTKRREKSIGMPKNGELTPVEVGGVPSYLFVQPVTLPADGTETALPKLYVAGLVSRHELEREATHIPVVWVVFMCLPVLLLFLALPFIKLATITPKERYGFADVTLLGLATICAAGVGAGLPFHPVSVNEKSDDALARAAQGIEKRLAIETGRVLDLADILQTHEEKLKLFLSRCQDQVEPALGPKRCGLWGVVKSQKAVLTTKRVPAQALDDLLGTLEVDIVAWVNRDGMQVQKWTTKDVATVMTSHRSFVHFRDLMMDHTWRLADEKGHSSDDVPAFTIDPLRSPTTAETGFIFGLAATAKAHATEFFVLNVRPQSVVDPIMPPGYGFAVLSPDGNVLFHSEEALSLKENFLEEVNNPAEVRGWLQSDHEVAWSGDYHGRPHRLHSRPIAAFVGSRWRIVAFQEMEPVLQAQLAQQMATLRLWTLNILALCVLLVIFWGFSRFKSRKVRDIMLAPGAANTISLALLSTLTAVAIVAVALTYRAGAVRHLDVLAFLFATIPVLAVFVALASRHYMPKARRSPRHQTPEVRLSNEWRGVYEIVLLLVLVGVVPAIGFARVASRLHGAADTARWLERAVDRWDARRLTVADRVNGPAYHHGVDRARQAEQVEQAKVPKTWALAPRDSAEGEPPFSYLHWISNATLTPSSGAQGTAFTTGQDYVRALLTWTPYGTRDESTLAPVTMAGDSQLHLAAREPAQSPAIYASLEGSGIEAWSGPKTLIGIAILVATALALCWARRRLVAPPFIAGPTLGEQLNQLSPTGMETILLIGPPRRKKDKFVEIAVKRKTGKPPADRLQLLDQPLDEAYITRAVARINAIAQRADAPLAPDGRLWIHLSNLEAQLVNATSRGQVLRLLEMLHDTRSCRVAKVMIVTTSVDPIANFEEVFGTERQGIYNDVVPEIGLSRSSLLLSLFRRCYLPIKCETSAIKRWEHWLNYEPAKWRKTLDYEAAKFEPLMHIAREMRGCVWSHGVPSINELAEVFTARAQAAYQVLWTSCTRSEKLVLIQLAQEGLVNPKSYDVVSRLIVKGLVVSKPGLSVFNYTFRQFLREIEHDQVVNEWERMEGTGLWVTAGRLVGSSVLAGAMFFLLTQDLSVQSLLPIVSGTGVFGLPIVRELIARFSGRSSDARAT